MPFDLSNPHVLYVLAAYAVAAGLLGGLVVFTFASWLKARRGKR